VTVTEERLTSQAIDAAWLAAYQRDGYGVVSGLFSDHEAARMRVWADDVAGAAPLRGGPMLYTDDAARAAGRSVLSRVEYFRNCHAGFRAVMEDPRLLAVLDRVLGKPAVLFKDKINYKLPGSSGFEPHQDAQAGWDRYCATHVTALVSLDATTHENGCLELAAGQHRRGLIGRPWQPLDGEELRALEFVALPTGPGDLCLFDSYVPHRSAPTQSGTPRRVLLLTYNPASEGDHYEAYFTDKRTAYPPDSEREPGRAYRYRV
jgi:2-aminoethylphosphonate dioxygenase